MVKLSEIDKFFLYSIQSKKDVIINELQLSEEDGILKIMRNNFSRFWNMLSEEQRIKYVKLAVDKENIYEVIKKIIRYADEVSSHIFIDDFMDVIMWDYSYSTNNIKNETDDDDKLNNLKHNILRFWIGLTNDEKKKFISIINKYWEKMNILNIIIKKKY